MSNQAYHNVGRSATSPKEFICRYCGHQPLHWEQDGGRYVPAEADGIAHRCAQYQEAKAAPEPTRTDRMVAALERIARALEVANNG